MKKILIFLLSIVFIFNSCKKDGINPINTNTVPAAPTLLSPTNVSTDVAVAPNFIWNTSSGAASYTLQVSTNNSFSSFIYNQSGITGSSQQVTMLFTSTIYYWRVSATNSYGTSDWSTVRSFTTKVAPPVLSSPANNKTNVATTPTLSWNSVATSYTLQVSINSSFSSYIYNQSGLTSTSQQVMGLGYGSTYYWRVSATNTYGMSEWSSVWNFTTVAYICGTSTISYLGKTYNIVQIGSQCWLKENLDVGTMIFGNQSALNNGSIEKYCYNDDSANCTTYGGLYQWNEAMQYVTTEKAKGICPSGWHIPTQAEFQTLATAVSNDGNALKGVGQGIGVGAGTNSSGFSALLAGFRYDNGGFNYLGSDTFFWSSTEYGAANAFSMILNAYNSSITFDYYYKDFGFSVRCIKN